MNLKYLNAEEYTSHNTHQLSLQETKELLLKLPVIRKDIFGEKEEKVFEN